MRPGTAGHGGAWHGVVPSFGNSTVGMFDTKGELQMLRLTPNKLVRRAVEAIMAATAELPRGEVMSHEFLERASGLERDSKDWKLLIIKLKSRFERERGITLWAEPTVGYRLMMPCEQLNEAVQRRSKRAFRQLHKGMSHMNAIPDDELNSHEKTVRATRQAAQRRAMSEVRRMRRVGLALMQPSRRNHNNSEE